MDETSQTKKQDRISPPSKKRRIMPVGEPKQGNGRTDTVYVFEHPEEPSVVLATRTLSERWYHTFEIIPTASTYRIGRVAFDAQGAVKGELPGQLDSDSELLYIVEGNGVMYPDSVEQACDVALEPEDVVEFYSHEGEMAPILALGKTVAKRAREKLSESGGDIEQLVKLLGVTSKKVTLDKGYWKRKLDPKDVKKATWKLLQCMQWRPGGLVARYLNRPVSLRITRAIVDTRISPNHMSVVGLLLGIAGVGAFFTPYWWAAIVGAILMQVNSVVDGIDGELARIRLRQTDLGAMLDSMGDEVLNTLLLGATGYYLFSRGFGNHYLWMGICAGLANATYAIVHWHCRLTTGYGFYWWWEAYKPRKQVQRSTSAWTYFKKLFMKESIYFLYVPAAIFGGLWVVVWIGFGAAIVVWLLLFIHIVIVRARW